ncbi:sensor histidine kinase [Actinomadura fibrosa]|uniref:histidine kinase n=1 Tax=Actinomadura fibrosa TaxID=111802 RepID=A0ABW2XPE2_9ACTN|nr:ATP-binding protein [Actinomadura fibrosa]
MGLRWTIRLRLTLLCGALFAAAGAALLAVTYLLATRALPWAGIEPPRPPDLGLPGPPPGVPDVPDPASRADDLRQFLLASVLGLVLMTVVAVGLGWLLAGRALRPLRAMAATARDISARSLHRRLAVRGPADEVKDLADTVDGLLDRLEASFEAQKAFVAHASHELRTPLTFERSLLEVTLADEDAAAATLRTACLRVLDSNRRQERLIAALLTLARGQRGLDHREDLDLAVIAATVLDRPAAPDHPAAPGRAAGEGPVVEAELDPAPTVGDARLVERLVANLADNAVRYNVPDGRVVIRTGVHGGRPTLCVGNTGPVVAPEDAAALVRPFTRLERGRTGDGGGGDGLGLGLSIVAAIAGAHGADLDVCARPGGGLDVRVAFPPPPDPPGPPPLP